jgi:hypothetical protein
VVGFAVFYHLQFFCSKKLNGGKKHRTAAATSRQLHGVQLGMLDAQISVCNFFKQNRNGAE